MLIVGKSWLVSYHNLVNTGIQSAIRFKKKTLLHAQGHRNKTAAQRSCDQPVPPSSTKMVLIPSLLFILACLSGSFGQEDLQKKVFVFPAASRKAFVLLKVPLQEPLASLSVCLKHHCPLSRPYSLFSYATRSSDNDFLIFKDKPNMYSVTVGGSVVNFNIPKKDIPQWEHVCVSWSSTDGLIYFWLDGVLLPRLGTKKGYRISPQAHIVLGQDQDTFGGGFDINQSFMGDMSEVNVWSQMLTTDDVRLLMKGDTVPKALASWNSFNYTLHDYVVVKDEVP
ncbi:hypothetical protein Chor_014776 [Crotalus horridus]